MKNKQKAWRKIAAQMKSDAIKEGAHTKGQRYGRWAKELHTAVPPFVSPLFLALRDGALAEARRRRDPQVLV